MTERKKYALLAIVGLVIICISQTSAIKEFIQGILLGFALVIELFSIYKLSKEDKSPTQE